MKDLMKAPLEGTVDTDPRYVHPVVQQYHDLVTKDLMDRVKSGGGYRVIEGELVDKGVEVTVYRDPPPIESFLTESFERRRGHKQELMANQNALEGEFEQGPSADMRKFFLPGGGIDVFALSAKAHRLAPKPAIEGELIKARDSNAGSHKIEDFDPESVNGLRHALQEIQTAVEGEFISKDDRVIALRPGWNFICEPGIAVATKWRK